MPTNLLIEFVGKTNLDNETSAAVWVKLSISIQRYIKYQTVMIRKGEIKNITTYFAIFLQSNENIMQTIFSSHRKVIKKITIVLTQVIMELVWEAIKKLFCLIFWNIVYPENLIYYEPNKPFSLLDCCFSFEED